MLSSPSPSFPIVQPTQRSASYCYGATNQLSFRRRSLDGCRDLGLVELALDAAGEPLEVGVGVGAAVAGGPIARQQLR